MEIDLFYAQRAARVSRMVTRIEIANRPEQIDPRGREATRGVRSFLGIPVERIRTVDVYHVEAGLEAGEAERILHELTDPVLQRGAIGRLESEPCDCAVTVGYKPWGLDPVGTSARFAIGWGWWSRKA